jgi:tetratricopeptide (TPR) repeat protein
MRRLWCIAVVCVFVLSAQDDAISRAVAAHERGDLAYAEQTLQAELKTQPSDAAALSVLAVVLDQEKKFGDADEIYRRALAVSPHSPALLNNYGNHLVATGKPSEARRVFLQVLALSPAHPNALVQLARIALEHKSADEALGYLDRLPTSAQQTTDVRILKVQAEYALHRTKEADEILERVSREAASDAKLNLSLGVALSSVGQYKKAESFFTRALEAEPGNFEALYYLGLAAEHAGHKERARDVLQQALEEQPENVDVLYDLAVVDTELNHKEQVLQLLARAAKLAPQRADIQFLLAHTSADFGYFGDAIQAWDRYLKLVPNDDVARRERAFAETAVGENMNAGIAELELVARKHPNDAVGHYELAIAKSATDRDQALKELDRALALKPDLAAAHMARGVLRYRQGNAEAALVDFEFAAQREPDNPNVLDRLGETYRALDRSANAVLVLRKAAELAPRDSTILLHLGRALANLGQTDEAKNVFARVRELGPNKSALPHQAGLVDFLSLSPDEQFARYRAGVERTVQKNPDNAEAQVRNLELLLSDGKIAEAAATGRKILALNPSPALLEEAAGAFLAAEQYSLASDFVRQAVNLAPSSNELKLDRAIAMFHVAGAQAGIEQMDGVPQQGRTGDYYLARMQMLEALGRQKDAEEALKQALKEKPTRPELYRQAALLLIKKQRTADALQLLDEAGRVLPNDADISFIRAIAVDRQANSQEYQRWLNDVQNRWPESYKVWSQTQ